MLKILHAKLQQYVNPELADVQTGFRKGRGSRDHMANIHGIKEKERIPEKHLLLHYWLCQSLRLCGSQQTGKFLKIPDHLICLLRNQYASQEAIVRTRHRTTDFQIGKGVCQVSILSPCLFNLYASCKMPGWMKHKLESVLPGGGAVPRWQRNRTGKPLSPPQFHQKIIWMLSNFNKTTSEAWWRTTGTQKDGPISPKGCRTKYKRQKQGQKI